MPAGTGSDTRRPRMVWVILTTGGRPEELGRAVASVLGGPEEIRPGEIRPDQVRPDEAQPDEHRPDDVSGRRNLGVVVVSNGAGRLAFDDPRVRVLELAENVGAPGGRDAAVRTLGGDVDVVGFLDDDAELAPGATGLIVELFEADPALGVTTFRLVDERGDTQRRHLPRIGEDGADESGEVALFLEGACAMRRAAYVDAGGYFTDLVYAHEALEFSWRLVERGWSIRYVTEVRVFHPHTTIGRHPDGWRRTGRNRVWIARRTLPWPVAIVHVGLWLVEGARRAPDAASRRAYVSGWWSGWSTPVERDPISWRTVLRLARLGRPPIV